MPTTMCLNPIYAYNNTRYVSLRHGDRFKVAYKCGHCAECLAQKSNEWQLRTYYQFADTISNGGYVLFDTLTYANAYLPRFSDYFANVPLWADHPCFSREHITQFIKALRSKLDYYGYSDKFGYFIASEYGSDDRFTHRPHYHVLIFSSGDVPPDVLSRFIGDTWRYGRTDGIPYKSRFYVNSKRVYKSLDNVSMVTAQYVAKYVAKHSAFEDIVRQRVNAVVASIYDDVTTRDARCFKIKVKHQVEQFFTTSNHYGESGLSDIDLIDLYNTGMIAYPVPKLQIVKHIPIPMYYQRKLFYDKIVVDGKRGWQLNDDGKRFRLAMLPVQAANLLKRLESWKSSIYNYFADNELIKDIKQRLKSIDLSALAKYMIYERGRFFGSVDFANVEDKISETTPLIYGYCTSIDREHYGRKFLSFNWLGNDVVGYKPPDKTITYKEFGNLFTWYKWKFEEIIELYKESLAYITDCKQGMYDYKCNKTSVVKQLLIPFVA